MHGGIYMKNLNIFTNIILEVKEAIHYFRIQDFFHGQNQLSNIYNLIDTIINDNFFPELSVELLSDVESIFSAQHSSDNILIADLLEMSLLPDLEKALLEYLNNNSVQEFPDYFDANIDALSDFTLANKIIEYDKKLPVQEDFYIEPTHIGLPTLRYENKNKSLYFHSNINPIEEANSLAAYYAKKDCFNYTILGFGLGYHVQALLEQDRRFKIISIETNLSVLTCAFHSRDLTELLKNPRFTLHYCKLEETMNYITKNTSSALLIHAPSLASLGDSAIKRLLQTYFIQISSMYSQGQLLCENYYYNIKRKDESILFIREKIKRKDVIYIAGGPSLEYFIDFIREKNRSTDTIIFCASTVYKKLLEKKITPDFVIMIDAQDNMVNHLKDVRKTSTQLIYLCTASSQAVDQFDGKRYICFQKGYPDAEKYAASHQIPLIETGGTVSSAALDIILQFEAKSLTTVGLDLAYTDNKRHSFDNDIANTSSSEFPMVKSVTGDLIPTANNFNIYREWIEKRIASVTNTELLNLSHGAFINGMRNQSSVPV